MVQHMDSHELSKTSTTVAALAADLPTASMFSLFDISRLAILEPSISQATDAACQSTGIKQRIDLIVTPHDAPYAAASGNQCPWHAIAFPIALTPAGAQDAREVLTSVLV